MLPPLGSVLVYIACGKSENGLISVFLLGSFFPLTIGKFCFPYPFKAQLSTFTNYLDIILVGIPLDISKELEKLTTFEF